MKKIGKNMLTKMMLSYSGVMIGIIVLFSVAAYFALSASVTGRVINASLSVLTQTVKWIDFSLENLEINASLIENEDYVNDFISVEKYDGGPLSPKTLDTVRNVKDQLANKFLINNMISNAYLYSYRTKMVISTDGGMRTADEMFDIDWLPAVETKSFPNGWTVRKLQRYYEEEGDGGEDVLTLVRQIPVFTQNPSGAFIINVRERQIYNMIYDNMKLTGARAMILDEDGKIISHSDPAMIGRNVSDVRLSYENRLLGQKSSFSFRAKQDSRNVVVLGYRSEYNGWQYIFEADHSAFVGGVRLWGILLVLVVLMMAVGCVWLVRKISKRIYSPVETVVHMASNAVGGGKEADEMSVISGAIRHLDSERYRLSRIFQENRQTLKERFIKDLVTGTLTSETQFEQQCRYLDIRFSDQPFRVCLIQIDHYVNFCSMYNAYDRGMLKYGIANITEELLGEAYFTLACDYEEDLVVAVINGANADIKSSLERVRDSIAENLEIYSTIGYSRELSGTRSVAECFRQAQAAVNRRFLAGHGRVLDYLEEHPLNPTELEPDLQIAVNLVKAGDMKKINVFVDETAGKLKKCGGVRLDTVKLILMNLVKSVSEEPGIHATSVDRMMEGMESPETLDEIMQWLKNVLTSLAGAGSVPAGNSRQQYMNQILECVNDNYQKDISLEWVGDQMKLSPQYISSLFKQECGVTFLNYLNKIRIEAAKKLLSDSGDLATVNSIGEAVGFNNVHTFMRVFKKYEGITPGKYREIACGK